MNDPDVVAEIARQIIPIDPSAAAGRILRYAVKLTASTGGAVLVPREEGGCSLFMVCDLDAAVGSEIPNTWRRAEIWLQRGQPVQHPGYVLFPIRTAGPDGHLMGGLFLHAPTRYDAATVDTLAPYLGDAIAAAGVGRLRPPPPPGRTREELLELLAQNEWNIARVARLCGVTRRTVYLRMQRYNIGRQRVPKSVYHPKTGPRT